MKYKLKNVPASVRRHSNKAIVTLSNSFDSTLFHRAEKEVRLCNKLIGSLLLNKFDNIYCLMKIDMTSMNSAKRKFEQLVAVSWTPAKRKVTIS